MIAREKVLKLGVGDAAALLDHFTDMQNKDPNFFYRMDIDVEGRLKNVFWADNKCREAYIEFGEVVTFDTTYLTNKVAPGGIITDQAGVMKISIEIVFKDTKHRWCLWHIMKKIPEKLRRYDNYIRIKSRMKKVVYDSQCPAEFEERWSEILEKYESLKQNKWLSKLYRKKDRWIPCFVKTTFWAGMSTTQRSESMNAFFDGYVHSRTSLKQFVEKFDNALRYKKEMELKADARSFSKTIPTSTSYKMEKQIQKVYTHAKLVGEEDVL
ncbi:protein FAR1-RELATED SEQUENCE 6-like [Papaver somniferum]|uniref:protein FAR1-RELATED SEQUENCE 6-like n=1 Tax=Papaver somniferum TaxID=3469 RepID=UPI000E701116|nr:protein FAR1-RELATED SEQUENCE 6-like [Papaver somniferum]